MMKRRALISILALAFASVSSAPGRAQAESDAPAAGANVARAEGYAAAAFEAYRIRDYGRALLLYERALAAAPSADILYNIARIYDVGLRDRRFAIEYYERYSAESGATPERRLLVRQRLEELRAAERASRSLDPDDIDAIAREFPTAEAEPAPAPGAPPTHPSAGPGSLELGALALGTAGVLGVGLGVGFGLSARSRTEVWQHDCDGNACSSQRGVDAAQSAARRAGVATASFAIGGSLLALGAVLWWLDADERPPAESAGLQLTPLASGSSAGALVSGHF